LARRPWRAHLNSYSYAYNSLDQLTSDTGGSYAYDGETSPTAAGSTSFTYSQTTGLLTGQVTAGVPGAFTEDAAGARTFGEDPSGSVGFYGYDASGQLDSATTSPATASRSDAGFCLVTTKGNLDNFGGAPWYGSTSLQSIPSPIVAAAATPDGKGYWLLAKGGELYSYGDASADGYTNTLQAPGSAIASTPDGKGFWILTTAGNLDNFGDAPWYGSDGGTLPSGQTTTGLAITPDGKGYLLLKSNGGVDNFGDAAWYGSDADKLASDNPATAIARTADGKGYWILTALGNLDNFGDATWYGGPRASANGGNIGTTAVSITPTPDGKGYWVLGANGHLWAYGDATNSSYSGSLQATGVAVVGAPDVTHSSLTYDGLGQLATQTSNGVTEHFAYDQAASAPLLLTDGTEDYVYTPSGTPIEEVASAATSTSSVIYLLQDGTGSTRLLATCTGSVVATYAYDAYGNLTTESGSATTPLLFQGQYYDQALGAYDLRARWYDPGSAQFLSVDPLVATTNAPYTYASDDPVNLSDPSGLNDCGIFTAVCDVGDVAAGGANAVGGAISTVTTVGLRTAATLVAASPGGQVLSWVSQETGTTLGGCIGGSAYAGYGVTGSICYYATPSGQSGLTVAGGAGSVGPFGANLLIGPSFSNAQNLSDLGGWFIYAGGSVGEGPYSAGIEGLIGQNSCGKTIWSATPGWAPSLEVPAPLGVEGGGSYTWTYPRW
jgi:RHS repeat-associated protein